MTTPNNTINTTCGIYDTETTCIRHRDGDTTVRMPYIKWINNTGNLSFRSLRLSGWASKRARAMFDAGDLADEDGMLFDLEYYPGACINRLNRRLHA